MTEKVERNARLKELREQGGSYNSIAFQLFEEGFGKISPQRVAEILETQAKKEAE